MNARPALGQAFVAFDAYAATLIQWRFRRELMSPRQRILFDYWRAQGGDRGALSVAEFDPLAVWGCIGMLHILQFDAERGDFFYCVYGEEVAIAAQAAMHRRWVLQHPGGAGPVFHAHYRDLMDSGRPWLGEVLTADGGGVAPYWHRMVLPLVSPDGYACATLAEPLDAQPDRRDGRAKADISALDAERLDLAG